MRTRPIQAHRCPRCSLWYRSCSSDQVNTTSLEQRSHSHVVARSAARMAHGFGEPVPTTTGP